MALRLEPDFLKKLEYLHVVSKRTFAGHHRADRTSDKRGRGLEFADHRQYSPGDDFRHIDWNAYKRLTTDFSAAERAALFHDTAMRAYRLD